MSERQIFEHALELTDPVRREQFLSQACGADHELRQRIDALLTSHDEQSRFLETPVVQQIQTPSDSSGEATVQLPPRESAAQDDDSDSAQSADLSFLKPSTKPGSIGILGHYEILQVLGQGAFGIVFKAFDEKLQRHVAIKTMNVQMAATSPPRKRFLREARAAAAIRHDNVTQVYSVEEEPIPYLVMEYIDGITLHTKLNSVGPLDIPEMLHLGKQIAFGLAAAHEKGLVHRDIKPGNILLEKGAEQKVKITDFGLARAADDASLTQSGLIAGTPLYMAPEQALGQALDARTDLFSFGSVLYQMAAGHPPFRAPTTVAVLRRVVDDTQRPLKEVITEIPDWFVSIVNKLLAKKPEDRYQSAKEVADLLARCQSELQLAGQVTCVPASVRREPDGSGTVLTEQPGGSRPSLATPVKPYPRIRSWPVVLSVVLVMGIQVVGLMLQTNRTTTLALSIGAMLLSVLLGVGELLSFRKRQREFREGSAAALPEKNLTANKVIFALILGVLVISPILFGRHLSDRFNAWLWPAIPTLPATELTNGLNFDGKDDYVEFAPVNWSYPQFTIEAFVTSSPRSDNGNIVSLTSGGKPWEFMELYDGHQADPGKRQSGAQIMGKTPYATAYGPLTPGVRQHRALVFDGSHMHYYINGIWQGKRRAEAYEGEKWKRWNLKQLRLGSDGDGKKRFEGQIDQVRISKVARYNDNFAPVTSVASDEQTLALYNFDEGHGEVLKDASGHGHDGKIVGATWATPVSLPWEPDGTAPSPVAAPAPAIAPFSAEQANQHQTAWAKHLGIPAEFTDKHGMKFVLIPPGEFQMGYSQTELDTLTRELKQAGAGEFDLFAAGTSGPQHHVRITQPFYMSAHEVTVAQYRTFLDETKYLPTADQLGGKIKWADFIPKENSDPHPAVGVSWTDADSFCVLRSQKDGVTYRLPSEAEWEYACRAGSTTLWSFGENPAELGEYAVTSSAGVTQIQPVGSRKPNALGLFDMYGNAEEWCRDWHVQDYYAKSPVDDPVNLATPEDKNSGRVCRGGGVGSLPWQTRSSSRRWDYPSSPVVPRGFRVVITGDLKKAVPDLAASGWPNPSTGDPDRDAALWALSIRGHLAVWTEHEHEKQVTKVEELPEAPFRVLAMGVHVDCQTFSDNDLKKLGQLSKVGWLNIIGFNGDCERITDAGIDALTQSPISQSLGTLNLPMASRVTDASVSFINRLPQLQELCLPCPNVTDEGIRQLRLPALRGIRLDHCSVTPNAIETLRSQCPSITWLHLQSTKMTGAGLEQLREFPLTGLTLIHQSLTNADLKRLSQVATLKTLTISNTAGFTHEGIRELAVLSSLKTLGVTAADQVNDETLDAISQIPNLQSLNVGSCGFTDAGLRHLTRLSHLAELTLSSTATSDTGLELLAQIKTLEKVDLTGCKNITEEGVRKLQAALPKLTIVSDFPSLTANPTAWPNPSTGDPDRDVALWALSQSGGQVAITPNNEFITRSDQIPASKFEVQRVEFNKPVALSDADFERLSKLAHLQSLKLPLGNAPQGISPAALRHLANSPSAPSLEALWIESDWAGSAMSDETVALFNSFKGLKSLTLVGVQVSNAGIEQLRLPELSDIGFRGPVTAQGIESLVTHSPKLSSLGLVQTDLSGRGFELLSRLPVRSMTLANQRLTDQDLAVIAGNANLEHLYLSYSEGFTRNGIRELSKLTNLQSLGLVGTRRITDDSTLEVLSTYKSLINLQANECEITDDGLKHIVTLPSLRSLSLCTTPISDSGLEVLASVETLQSVDITDCQNVTQAGVSKLRAALPGCQITSNFPDVIAMTKDVDREVAEWAFEQGVIDMLIRQSSGEVLKVKHAEDLPDAPFHIDLLDVKIQNEGLDDSRLESLGQLTDLRFLVIRSEDVSIPLQNVTDRGLQRFADGPVSQKLEELHIGVHSGTLRVSDEAIASLNRMKKLWKLEIGCEQMTDDGLEKLDLPNLKALGFRGSLLTPAGIDAVVAKTDGLLYMHLWCEKFSGPELRRIAKWQVNQLDIQSPKTTDSDLRYFSTCSSLQMLRISDTSGCSVEGLRHLAALPNLKSLSLTSATDAWAQVIAKDFPALESLGLDASTITDEGLKSFSTLAQLKFFYLESRAITDDGLAHLTALRALDHLYVWACPRVTATGVRKLQAALPNCQIVSDFPGLAAVPLEGPQSTLVDSPDFHWSTPVNLGPNINTPGRDANPSLTSDELLIVFSRDGLLHEARRATREEPFGPATKLAGPFVASKNQSSACLSGDGLQIVFSSGAIGEEQQDIMLATRKTRDEPFGEPVRLPQPINSPDEDRHPVLSPDGLMLSLTSDRKEQKPGAALIFTRTSPDADFNPTPTVDPNLQVGWDVITSFSADGRGLLKTTMVDGQEKVTWHTRTGDANTWSAGQPLPARFDAIQYGGPFLSADGNTVYFHSRSLPDGQGELDLWMSRRTPKTP